MTMRIKERERQPCTKEFIHTVSSEEEISLNIDHTTHTNRTRYSVSGSFLRQFPAREHMQQGRELLYLSVKITHITDVQHMNPTVYTTEHGVTVTLNIINIIIQQTVLLILR